MNHDLINQVESLKVMMVSRARGELMATFLLQTWESKNT
jgi:hypothetical protein